MCTIPPEEGSPAAVLLGFDCAGARPGFVGWGAQIDIHGEVWSYKDTVAVGTTNPVKRTNKRHGKLGARTMVAIRNLRAVTLAGNAPLAHQPRPCVDCGWCKDSLSAPEGASVELQEVSVNGKDYRDDEAARALVRFMHDLYGHLGHGGL